MEPGSLSGSVTATACFQAMVGAPLHDYVLSSLSQSLVLVFCMCLFLHLVRWKEWDGTDDEEDDHRFQAHEQTCGS